MNLYTSQQLFTKVIDHMRTQGKTTNKYIEDPDDSGNCARCAKGCLMYDKQGNVLELYESIRASNQNKLFDLGLDVPSLGVIQEELLHKLENLYMGWHEFSDFDSHNWESGFQEIAEEFNLKIPQKQTKEFKKENIDELVGV